MKNVIFTVTKTAINLFMGYSLEMPHVIEPRDTTMVRPYTPSLPRRFLKALNNPYVTLMFKITRTKMFLIPKGVRSALKMPVIQSYKRTPNIFTLVQKVKISYVFFFYFYI